MTKGGGVEFVFVLQFSYFPVAPGNEKCICSCVIASRAQPSPWSLSFLNSAFSNKEGSKGGRGPSSTSSWHDMEIAPHGEKRGITSNSTLKPKP